MYGIEVTRRIDAPVERVLDTPACVEADMDAVESDCRPAAGRVTVTAPCGAQQVEWINAPTRRADARSL